MFRITKPTVAIALVLVWLFSEPTAAGFVAHGDCSPQASLAGR